jgi:Tol biopolymer transport system component
MSSAKAVPTAKYSKTQKSIWPAAAFVLFAALTAGILWWHPWKMKEKKDISSQLRLISNFPGSHSAASFSPDGSMIAFTSATEGASQIWIKNLAQGDPIQITNDEKSAERPAWSPNNDQIVFSRGTIDQEESIWTVPPLGGIPKKIIDPGRNPNFSRDGKQLIFERNQEIWVSDADGSNQEKVEGVPPAALLLSDRFPVFSPSGKKIAFFHAQVGPKGDYWILPLAGGKATRLTFDRCLGGRPVWNPSDSSIIFPSERSGSMTLWKIDPSGGKPEPVTTGAGIDKDPAMPPSGNKLVFTNTKNSSTDRKKPKIVFIPK